MESATTNGGASPVPIGVIGGGLVAQAVHLPLLKRVSDRFRVTALAEPDPRVRETVAARFCVGRAFADHRELLGSVEAVLVCSPDATHAQVVIDALRAGVHVLVEKPLCLTPEDADRIVAERDRAGVVVQVGYMKRFDPAFEALLEDLEMPSHVATATFDPGLREAFGLPAGPAMSVRAAWLGALIHDVNLVRAALDRCGATVERVVDAFGAQPGPRVGATFELTGGARWTAVWLGLPRAGAFREHLAFYGPDVRELEFPAPYVLHQPTLYRRTRASVTTVVSSWEEAYERQLVHFHDCIGGAACRTPAEDGAADVRLLAGMAA